MTDSTPVDEIERDELAEFIAEESARSDTFADSYADALRRSELVFNRRDSGGLPAKHDDDCPACHPTAVYRHFVTVDCNGHGVPIDDSHLIDGKSYCSDCVGEK